MGRSTCGWWREPAAAGADVEGGDRVARLWILVLAMIPRQPNRWALVEQAREK